MKKYWSAIVVAGLALAMTRDPAALSAVGAALLFVISAGYERRTHF